MTNQKIKFYFGSSSSFPTKETGSVYFIKEGSLWVGNNEIANLGSSNSTDYSISVTSAAGTGDVAKVYTISQNGNSFNINIPKDIMVSSGEVKTVGSGETPYTGANEGDTYIQLMLNGNTTPVNIPANSLVDVYTGNNGIAVSNYTISAVIDPTESNGISASSAGLSLALATTQSNGAMSAQDKRNLNDTLHSVVGTSGVTVSNKANGIQTISLEWASYEES